MKKLLLAAAAAMLAASYSHAQTEAQPTAPKREMRGVWISTHISLDWPSRFDTPAQQQAKLKAILDHNKATGMNAAFLQVRSQADAIYPSALEPWSSCADIGARKVVLTAVDKGGNSASAEGLVQVLGHVPQPAISVSPAAGEATGLPANTIALGYGPQSVTLTASGAVTSFAPGAAGSFSFTTQAASPESCFAQATATVNVIDARCGGGKVMVCNKTGSAANPGAQVCVSPNAVPAFLKKGACWERAGPDLRRVAGKAGHPTTANAAQPVLRKPAATPLMDR